MSEIIYKPHCGECGEAINKEVTIKSVLQFFRNETVPCENYTEIFPCKCEKCGAVFNVVKIIPPEKLPPKMLHIF